MAIAIVQQARVSGSPSTTSRTCSFSGNTTAGNAVIAVVTRGYWASGYNVSGVSGAGAGTFSLAKRQAGSATDCEVWYALNGAGGNATVTVTYPQSYSSTEIWILEVSGLETSGDPTDGTNGSTGFSAPGSSVDPGTVTPAGGVDVLLVSGCWTQGSIISAPASYTQLTGGTYGGAAYRIVTSPSGSYGGAWTVNSPYNRNASAIVAFKASGGGGGGTSSPYYLSYYSRLVLEVAH